MLTTISARLAATAAPTRRALVLRDRVGVPVQENAVEYVDSRSTQLGDPLDRRNVALYKYLFWLAAVSQSALSVISSCPRSAQVSFLPPL